LAVVYAVSSGSVTQLHCNNYCSFQFGARCA